MTTTTPTTTDRPARAVLTDSTTMLRRRLLHLVRYPSLTITVVVQPIVFLLLFVYVLGATLGAGLGGDRTTYLAYITPTILLLTVASVALATAIAIATDMTEGIVARFRTMPVARSALLTGHVVGAVVQTGLAVVAVLVVALALGFRPAADVAGWLGIAGVLALVTIAVTWLCLALGLAADSVETASNTPMFLILLPFLGSGFVPTETMPTALRVVAQYQPFTPVIDTLRALMSEVPAPSAWLAVTWCVAITVGSVLWALRLYERRAR